jgi:hypothetical protein
MKSNKQKRRELALRHEKRARKRAKIAARDPRRVEVMAAHAPCNPALLAPSNSYGVPAFVARGYYLDTRFTCGGCGSAEVWTATQQKWWYEIAKGNVESGAKYCRGCRRKERERSAEARRVHLEGVAKKKRRRDGGGR